MHDLLKPHVSRLVVCDPRKNALLKDGNKNDRIDVRKLAELLRTHQVKPVYHENHGTRALKELGRSYTTITKDVTRVMNRIKSVYRSWGDSLCRDQCLLLPSSCPVAGPAGGTRGEDSSPAFI